MKLVIICSLTSIQIGRCSKGNHLIIKFNYVGIVGFYSQTQSRFSAQFNVTPIKCGGVSCPCASLRPCVFGPSACRGTWPQGRAGTHRDVALKRVAKWFPQLIDKSEIPNMRIWDPGSTFKGYNCYLQFSDWGLVASPNQVRITHIRP